MQLDKVLTAVGRAFIFGGVLVFLFVAYQLWGTGLSEQRSQERLQQEAKRNFANALGHTPTTAAAPKPGVTTTAPPPLPNAGAIAVMRIPKIKLEKAVVEGTGVPDLKKGPGHYVETPMPGEKGNVGIAGHRTTYGAPFGDIGELKSGDDIIITTRRGTFTYKVKDQQIVTPETVSVLDPSNDNRLTLTTCHPKFSDRQRLIVTAILQDKPLTSETPPTTQKPNDPQSPKTLDGPSLSGEASSNVPAILWGIICLIAGVVIWLLARRFNKWAVYIVGTPIFLVLLYFFFENFARLLPANA